MDTHGHIEGNSKTNNDILSMLEADDLDFEFKPVTSGLGFNKPEENQDRMIKEKAKQRLQQKKRIAKTTVQRGDLSPFYSDVKETPKPTMEASLEKLLPKTESKVEPAVKLREVETVEADLSYRFVAHIIDLVLVFALTALTFGLFTFIADLNFAQLAKVKGMIHFQIAVVVILSSYYVFYFTFLDSTKGSTIGKSIVDIRVVNLDDERANIMKTFLKALLTVVSYPLLGALSFTGLTERMSGTKTIENGTL